MLGWRDRGCEQQALRIDPTRRGLTPQILAGGGIARRQPQHRARNSPEQAHPDVEDSSQNFVLTVETAKYECVVRQPTLGSTWRRRSHFAFRIAGTIAVRKIKKALGEKRLLILGRDKAVGDDVVVPVRAERSQIAKPADLHRRRPQGKKLATGVRGVAIEIDQHIDPIVADAPRNLL